MFKNFYIKKNQPLINVLIDDIKQDKNIKKDTIAINNEKIQKAIAVLKEINEEQKNSIFVEDNLTVYNDTNIRFNDKEMERIYEALGVEFKNKALDLSDEITTKNNNEFENLFANFFKTDLKNILDKNIPEEDNSNSNFSTHTQNLINQRIEHKTKLLDNAQELLGLIEATPEEFKDMTPEERRNTQYKVLGPTKRMDESWCAYTVSYLCKQTGIDIGDYKNQVSHFIEWAEKRNTYKPISNNEINELNFVFERDRRAEEIKKQLPNMNEGDFIIWKSNYIAYYKDEGLIESKTSHIGIIESVDPQKGTVTVIEGNANETLTGETFERDAVKTESEGRIGNQQIGEAKELNRRDGVIRKVYTIEDLAKFGYSGYIDNSNIVK